MTIAALWKREKLDLAELARLRWVEKWKIERIASHFGAGATAVKRRLIQLRESPSLTEWTLPERRLMRKMRGH